MDRGEKLLKEDRGSWTAQMSVTEIGRAVKNPLHILQHDKGSPAQITQLVCLVSSTFRCTVIVVLSTGMLLNTEMCVIAQLSIYCTLSYINP